MDVKLVGGSACQSEWLVDGVKIRYWIIVGGTPAVAFAEDYSFTRRFGKLAKYQHDTPWTGRYDHQQPGDVPDPGQDLPGGWDDIEAWLVEHLPLREIVMRRRAALEIAMAPGQRWGRLESRRIHDEYNRTYDRATFLPHMHLSVGYHCSGIYVPAGWLLLELACEEADGDMVTMSDASFNEIVRRVEAIAANPKLHR